MGGSFLLHHSLTSSLSSRSLSISSVLTVLQEVFMILLRNGDLLCTLETQMLTDGLIKMKISNGTSLLNGKDTISRPCSHLGSSSLNSSLDLKLQLKMLWLLSTITSTQLSSTFGCSSGGLLS